MLTGVVEEKASRVVEVLLAHMPARNLLAGKVTGIGVLGFGQIAMAVARRTRGDMEVDSVDIPAVRGGVLAWVVVWFVLGYTLYAMAYGALGALVSRAEDAQSAAGPVSVVLIAGYFAAFATIGSPDTAWARAVSFFPVTAPLAMPNRIAMGATAWWEPVVASHHGRGIASWFGGVSTAAASTRTHAGLGGLCAVSTGIAKQRHANRR